MEKELEIKLRRMFKEGKTASLPKMVALSYELLFNWEFYNENRRIPTEEETLSFLESMTKVKFDTAENRDNL